MGSLTSGPSAPTVEPQVVYVPQTTTTTTSTSSTASTTDASSSDTTDTTSAEIRTQNLLDRERSRFGTVQTSFRGLLGLSSQDNAQTRKTLLGG